MGSYWEPDVLSKVVHLLREKKLYLFAGAGLSYLAGYPLWKDLLWRFANEYTVSPYRRDEIASAMNALVDERNLNILQHLIDLGEHGNNAFVRVLKESFKEEKTSEAHRMLIQLPFAGYVTINYDKCLEKASEQINEAKELLSNRWFCFPKHKRAPERNLDEIYDGNKFLLHMHGCLYYEGRIDTQNIILMKDQYCKFYKCDKIEKIFTEMFYRPFLIFGTSFSDPFFMNKLFEARGSHDRDIKNEREICYVVLPECEKRETDPSNEDVYGVRFNYFDKNDNNAIENMVMELKGAYEQATVRVNPKEQETI